MTSDPESANEVGLLPIFTLVLWLSCMAVGLVGLLYSPSRSPPPTTQPTTVPITMDVSVVDEPMVAADVEPQPSPSPPEMSSPDLPPVQAVVLPNPAIAFAVPTDAPVRASRIPIALPTVHHLVFGQGEGQQPQPEYPSEAAMAGQQGTVVVMFTVNESGRVVEAHASNPSPWPLLNNSAIQTIRQSWRFPPGPRRAYEVAIQFLLTQQ